MAVLDEAASLLSSMGASASEATRFAERGVSRFQEPGSDSETDDGDADVMIMGGGGADAKMDSLRMDDDSSEDARQDGGLGEGDARPDEPQNVTPLDFLELKLYGLLYRVPSEFFETSDGKQGGIDGPSSPRPYRGKILADLPLPSHRRPHGNMWPTLFWCRAFGVAEIVTTSAVAIVWHRYLIAESDAKASIGGGTSSKLHILPTTLVNMLNSIRRASDSARPSDGAEKAMGAGQRDSKPRVRGNADAPSSRAFSNVGPSDGKAVSKLGSSVESARADERFAHEYSYRDWSQFCRALRPKNWSAINLALTASQIADLSGNRYAWIPLSGNAATGPVTRSLWRARLVNNSRVEVNFHFLRDANETVVVNLSTQNLRAALYKRLEAVREGGDQLEIANGLLDSVMKRLFHDDQEWDKIFQGRSSHPRPVAASATGSLSRNVSLDTSVSDARNARMPRAASAQTAFPDTTSRRSPTGAAGRIRPLTAGGRRSMPRRRGARNATLSAATRTLVKTSQRFNQARRKLAEIRVLYTSCTSTANRARRELKKLVSDRNASRAGIKNLRKKRDRVAAEVERARAKCQDLQVASLDHERKIRAFGETLRAVTSVHDEKKKAHAATVSELKDLREKQAVVRQLMKDHQKHTRTLVRTQSRFQSRKSDLDTYHRRNPEAKDAQVLSKLEKIAEAAGSEVKATEKRRAMIESKLDSIISPLVAFTEGMEGGDAKAAGKPVSGTVSGAEESNVDHMDERDGRIREVDHMDELDRRIREAADRLAKIAAELEASEEKSQEERKRISEANQTLNEKLAHASVSLKDVQARMKLRKEELNRIDVSMESVRLKVKALAQNIRAKEAATQLQQASEAKQGTQLIAAASAFRKSRASFDRSLNLFARYVLQAPSSEGLATWNAVMEAVEAMVDRVGDLAYRRFKFFFESQNRCDGRVLGALNTRVLKLYWCANGASLPHHLAVRAVEHRSWLACLGYVYTLDYDSLYLCEPPQQEWRSVGARQSRSISRADVLRTKKNSPAAQAVAAAKELLKKRRAEVSERVRAGSKFVLSARQSLLLNLREAISFFVLGARTAKARNACIAQILIAASWFDVGAVFRWVSELAFKEKVLQNFEEFKAITNEVATSASPAADAKEATSIDADIIQAFESAVLVAAPNSLAEYRRAYAMRRDIKAGQPVSLYDAEKDAWEAAFVFERVFEPLSGRTAVSVQMRSTGAIQYTSRFSRVLRLGTDDATPAPTPKLRRGHGSRGEAFLSVGSTMELGRLDEGKSGGAGIPAGPMSNVSDTRRGRKRRSFSSSAQRVSLSADGGSALFDSSISATMTSRPAKPGAIDVARTDDVDFAVPLTLDRSWFLYTADFEDARWPWPSLLHLLADRDPSTFSGPAGGAHGAGSHLDFMVRTVIRWDTGRWGNGWGNGRGKVLRRVPVQEIQDHNQRIPIILAVVRQKKALFRALFEASTVSYMEFVDKTGNSLLHYLVASPIFSAKEVFGEKHEVVKHIRTRPGDGFRVILDRGIVQRASRYARLQGVSPGSRIISINGRSPLMRRRYVLDSKNIDDSNEDETSLLSVARFTGYYIRALCEKGEASGDPSFHAQLLTYRESGDAINPVSGVTVMRGTTPKINQAADEKYGGGATAPRISKGLAAGGAPDQKRRPADQKLERGKGDREAGPPAQLASNLGTIAPGGRGGGAQIVDIADVKLLDIAFFKRIAYFFNQLRNAKGHNVLENFLAESDQSHLGMLYSSYLINCSRRDTRGPALGTPMLSFPKWRQSHVWDKLVAMIERGASLSEWTNHEVEWQGGSAQRGTPAAADNQSPVERLESVLFEMMLFETGAKVSDESGLHDPTAFVSQLKRRSIVGPSGPLPPSRSKRPGLSSSLQDTKRNAGKTHQARDSLHGGSPTKYSWRVLRSAVQQGSVPFVDMLLSGRFARYQLPQLSTCNLDTTLLHLACDDYTCIRRSDKIVKLILDYNSKLHRHRLDGMFHPGASTRESDDSPTLSLDINAENTVAHQIPAHMSPLQLEMICGAQLQPFKTGRTALQLASSTLMTDASEGSVSSRITQLLMRRHAKIGSFDRTNMTELHLAVLGNQLLTLEELSNYSDLNAATKPVTSSVVSRVPGTHASRDTRAFSLVETMPTKQATREKKVGSFVLDAPGFLVLPCPPQSVREIRTPTGRLTEVTVPVYSRRCRFRHGGETGLHLAALNGLTDVASLLINKGADIDASDKRGLTPLGAAMMRYKDIGEFFEARYPGNAVTDPESMSRILLNTNGGTVSRDMLLRLSELKESLRETIVLLLKRGADLDMAQKFSGTQFEECFDIPTMFKEIVEQEKEFVAFAQTSDDARRIRSVNESVKNLFGNRMTQIVCDTVYRTEIRKLRVCEFYKYMVFLVILSYTVVDLATKDRRGSFWFQKSLQQGLVEDEYPYSVSQLPRSFKDIDSIDEFWMWLEGPFLDKFYPSYAEVPRYWDSSGSEILRRGYIDGQSRVLGVPRIRQIRSSVVSCNAPGSLTLDGEVCFSLTGCLTPAIDCTTGIEMSTIDIGSTTYPYQHPQDLEATGTVEWGQFNRWYPIAGYVQEFPSVWSNASYANASALIATLKAANWIDSLTRMVTVEFSLYNAHTDDMCSASLMAEFPLTGGVVVSHDFHVGNFLHYSDGYWLAAAEIMVTIGFIYYAMQRYDIASVQGVWKFLSRATNWIMITMIFIWTVCIALYIDARVIELRTDWQSTMRFVPIDRLALRVRTMTSLLSFLIALAWWELMNYLTIFKAFSELLIMIEFMVSAMVPLIILLLFVLMSFAFAEYVGYGYLDPNSHTLWLSVIARLVETFDGIDYSTAANYDRVLGTLWSVLFVLVLGVLVLNLIIAVLNYQYDNAREFVGKRHWAHHQYREVILHWLLRKKHEQRAQRHREGWCGALAQRWERFREGCNSCLVGMARRAYFAVACVHRFAAKMYNFCVIPSSQSYLQRISKLEVASLLREVRENVRSHRGMDDSIHQLPVSGRAAQPSMLWRTDPADTNESTKGSCCSGCCLPCSRWCFEQKVWLRWLCPCLRRQGGLDARTSSADRHKLDIRGYSSMSVYTDLNSGLRMRTAMDDEAQFDKSLQNVAAWSKPAVDSKSRVFTRGRNRHGPGDVELVTV